MGVSHLMVTLSCDQDNDTMACFVDAQKVVEASYIEGKPLHVSRPEESMIRIMTQGELDGKTTREVQAIFAQQHILIVDAVEKERQFSWCKQDLQGVTEWHKPLSVHGEELVQLDSYRTLMFGMKRLLHQTQTERVPAEGCG